MSLWFYIAVQSTLAYCLCCMSLKVSAIVWAGFSEYTSILLLLKAIGRTCENLVCEYRDGLLEGLGCTHSVFKHTLKPWWLKWGSAHTSSATFLFGLEAWRSGDCWGPGLLWQGFLTWTSCLAGSGPGFGYFSSLLPLHVCFPEVNFLMKFLHLLQQKWWDWFKHHRFVSKSMGLGVLLLRDRKKPMFFGHLMNSVDFLLISFQLYLGDVGTAMRCEIPLSVTAFVTP